MSRRDVNTMTKNMTEHISTGGRHASNGYRQAARANTTFMGLPTAPQLIH